MKSIVNTYPAKWFVLVLATVLTIGVSSWYGETASRAEVRELLFSLRLQRAVVASLAGGGLALAGAVFQALFRNPLATPYTLGVASGGSLGATIALVVGAGAGLPRLLCGMPLVSWAALLGALAVTFTVYLLARSDKLRAGESMLLAGVSINLFCASLVLVLQYVADPSCAMRIIRWTVGGLDSPRWSDAIRLAPLVIGYAVFLVSQSRELNIIGVGEERAASLGLSVATFRTILFVTTSIVVGMIVATCGPIGFVGLMVPHLVRLVTGPDHGVLLPATFLAGAFFLTLCDLVARNLVAGCELPVGAVTSLLGGPFFVGLMLTRR
ncbi:MAG: FecCD family ABC transporter permease [Thermoguttaceae bacterium]